MARHLPHVMQQLLGTPLCVTASHASMIAAAFAGKLDIRSIATEFERLDQRALADLAATGRLAADQTRLAQQHKPGAAMFGNDTSWNGRVYPLVNGIAVINIWGTLTRTWGVGPYSGSTGYDGIQTQLMTAMNDPKVNAIWLDINSPGGAVDGLFDLQELIWSVNEKNGGKPIWAFAGDHAYSAAFAIGVAADKFFVPQTGGVGSVGVITLWADMQKALEQEGIAVRVFRSGAKKALGYGGFEDLPEESVAHIQGQLDEIRDLFVERVAQYRGISKSSVLQTEGLDYMGRHAKSVGFVTDVLSEHAAWAKLERKLAR
jgi:capsid assembly protease